MLQNERDLFKLLSDQIGRKITERNEQVFIEFEGLTTIFAEAKKQLLETFDKQISSEDEREELSEYLKWLISELFSIALHDDEHRTINKENIELQNFIFLESFLKQRWFFIKLIDIYIKALQQVINGDPCKDHRSRGETTGMDISIEPPPHKINLDYKKIIITNERQKENIIQMCLAICKKSAQLYCNVFEGKGKLIRNAAIDAMRKSPLNIKTSALSFLTEYYTHRCSLSDEDTLLFISILQTLSIIFRDIPMWTQDATATELFNETSKNFFKEFPVIRMKLNNQKNLHLLVVSVSEILWYNLKNGQNRNTALEPATEMLVKVLDDVDYAPGTVDGLRNLFQFEQPNVLQLMRYVVIADIEEAPIFNSNVSQISATWQYIYKRLLLKVSELNNDNFYFHLGWILDIFFLALQIDFDFTHRHQIRHGLHPKTCFCSSINFEESQKPQSLMKWNDKHVVLTMFKDLEEIAQNLMKAITKKPELSAEEASCVIDVISCIMKFSVNTTMIETLKQLLIAVLASPFYIPLKQHQKMSKELGFQKIMGLLPANIKKFYETLKMEEYMNKLQSDSIAAFSQLKITRMDTSCWILLENIIEYITSKAKKSLKEAFCNNLTNFCINNNDKFGSLIETYQKLLQDQSIGSSCLEPLSDVLCLTGGNVAIIKLLSNEHAFSYFIVCNVCELSSMDWARDSKADELHRHVAYIKEARGVLVSSDNFADRNLSLKCDAEKMFSQTNDYIIHLIPNIAPLLNHSTDTKQWIEKWKGLTFFDKIFVKDERVLLVLKENLKDIIRNIREKDYGKDLKDVLFNCLFHIAEIVHWTEFGKDKSLQSITINLVFTYAVNVIDENVMVKCLKMLSYYIVQTNSKVMAEASLLALEVAKRYGAPLIQLFNWHKTFIMRHVFNLMMINFFSFKTPLLNSMINFIKRLNFPRLRDFLPTTIDIIVAIALPSGVQVEKVITSLNALCNAANLSLKEAIEANFITIYQEIYSAHFEESKKLYMQCLEFIEKTTEKTITDMLTVKTKKTIEEALVCFNKAPNFVMEVMSKILGGGRDITERIANDISERFLGVLIYFEAKLTSNECERVTKKEILLSLGDIIRLLTEKRVSGVCFKIIAVLKVAKEQKSIDLSETCMEVWSILIRNCEVTSLGPILSTIFVSLEAFIDKYPDKVKEIYSYLVKENSSLLSLHMTDLFFIEKTKVDNEIKAIVMQQIESQKLRDESTFKSSLRSLIRHLTSETTDLKVRIYCLQYLKELLMMHRQELNELICGQMLMDPVVEELLLNLIKNCKNTNSDDLQLALAECIGEIGAIEPSLQKRNYSSQKKFPKTIHSDEFAIMALTELCNSYRNKNDSKYIDALALAIQTILKSRNVSSANKNVSEVWHAIPEKLRPLMEPLFSSNYGPTKTKIFDQCPIFWAIAQNTSDWVLKWSAKLIDSIQKEDTKMLLERIRPSMKQNQNTMSMFLPYIILHTLEMENEKVCKEIALEIQSIFDIVLGKSTNKEKSQVERKHLYIKSFDFNPKQISKSSSKNIIKTTGIETAKVVFDILDFLENYLRTHEWSQISSSVDSFLNTFSLDEMAAVGYECGEYARAMVYLETQMKKMKGTENFQERIAFLTNIYAKLGNSDAVEGIQILKNSEWSLTEKVMVNSTIGNFQDSAVCFEMMTQVGELKIEHIQMMIHSFLSLDQPETALLVYENLMRKFNETHQNHLSDEIKAEPLWRLSRFDELKELLEDPVIQESTSWGVKCGQLLLEFRKDNDESFVDELRNTRRALMKNLKIFDNEQAAYGKSYREVVNLHLVSELEKVGRAVVDIKEKREKDPSIAILNIIEEWDKRMEIVQKKAAIEEPIYRFHRIILSEMKLKLQKFLREDQLFTVNQLLDNEVGNLWIRSAKLACKNKMYQQAQTYILNADNYKPKGLFIEKAKLYWIKNDQINAFKALELGTKSLLDGRSVNELETIEKKLYSKGKLMIARYNAEAVNVDFETNKAMFLEARVKGVETEKMFLITAEYMDRHYCSENDESLHQAFLNIGNPKYMIGIMRDYYKSMIFGSEHVFQSMPRFLSIWLDTTAKYHENIQHKAELEKINDFVENSIKHVNTFFFYTAFSQLISRICHQSTEVFAVLKSILVKLVQTFPQQSLWFLIPMLKSSHNPRVKRCRDILQDKRLNKPATLLINDFNSVVENLIKLANLPCSKESEVTIDRCVPDLTKFMRTRRSEIIMPFQCNLQLTRTSNPSAFKFADSIVYIQKIENKVEIMQSLQKPKKMTLIGSDGKKVSILLKPQDDARIDHRFMEFSNVLKEFLHKDRESRHRQLTFRTYSVIPLNESTGLIEWVPNFQTFKQIVFNQYMKKKHKVPSMLELEKKHIDKMTTEKKVEAYRQLIKVFYPALGDFYRQQFATPLAYYNARSAYILSVAMYSIIGYILGLGDRHPENILISVLSGEMLHVDCNMLFNKGEELKVPETVPFRLTHNMTDAMGVLGIEGPFKKNCEIILRVLQKEKQTLMSYLRPWVYEPVMKKNDLADARNDRSERIEPHAIDRIKNIELRLKGIVRKYKGSSGIALSTEGQVNFIIGEAMKEENLAAMWRGWTPWM